MLRTALIATALVSCAQPDELELGSTEQEAGCPLGQCGGNSPLLGPFKAEELNEVGLPNSAKVRLLGYVYPGSACTEAAPCRVDVKVDRMSVALPNGQVATQEALVGGYLLVWQPGDQNFSPPFPPGNAKIFLTHWSKGTNFWVGPGGSIDTFELRFEIPGYFEGPLCNNPPNATDEEGNQWVSRFESIFFTGDRYDHDTKRVYANSYQESGDWFNIACSGSATAKLHLNRHTTAGSTTGFDTTREQRQTMLKMYTGDFCGDGTTYTVLGTKIQWETNKGLTSPPVTGINSLESFWNEDGAVCMTRHRLASSTNPAEAALEKMIRLGYQQTPATCRRMPVCSRQHTGNYMKTSSAALP